MKNSFLKLALFTLAVATFATSSVSAHGPETYKNFCKEEFLDAWFKDEQGTASKECDPNNPPNITAGIENEYGSYPFGLCYPSFNNYINYTDSAFDTPTGMDPYGSQPPVFKDERNFFKVRKVNKDGQGQWVDYKDEITIDDGDSFKFMIYIHNDGDPCFNEGNPIPKNKFYSNWNTTSKNTRLSVQPNPNNTLINKPQTFTASIWSDNAVNAEGKIAPIFNNVKIKPKDNKELLLKYKETSGTYTDYDKNWNFTEHDLQFNNDIKDLFSTSGMPLTTLKDGKTKVAPGVHFASEPYIGVVLFEITAEQTGTCKELTAKLSNRTKTIEGKTAYEVKITSTFEGKQKEEAIYNLSSSNSKDTFYSVSGDKVQLIGTGSVKFTNAGEVFYVPDNPEKDATLEMSIKDAAQCSAKFKFNRIPTCRSVKTVIKDVNQNNKIVSCLKKGDYVLEAKFYEDTAQTKEIQSGTTKVKWETTDENAKFYNPLAYLLATLLENEPPSQKAPLEDLNVMKYIGRGDVKATLLAIDEKPFNVGRDKINFCAATIPECDNICTDIRFGAKTALEVGKDSELIIQLRDLFSEPLPEEMPILLKTDTEGYFVTSTQEAQSEILVTLKDFPVTFAQPRKEGSITVEIPETESYASEVCKASLQVAPATTCQYIEAQVGGGDFGDLKAGEFYQLKANTSYHPKNPETRMVEYSSTQGVFILPKVSGEAAIDQSTFTFAISIANKTKLTLKSTEAGEYENPFIKINKNITALDNQIVLFIPFTDTTATSGLNAITVKAKDRPESSCAKTANVLPVDQICKSLKITTFPEKFDPTQDMIIRVDGGEFGDFKGDLQFKTTNGKFFFPKEESKIASTQTFTMEQAKNGIVYTQGKHEDKVEITAIGDLSGTCKYTLTNAPLEVTCTGLEFTEPKGTWTEDDVEEGDEDEQEFLLNVTTKPAGYANNFKYRWESHGGDFKDTITSAKTSQNPLSNTLEDIDLDEKVSVTVSALDENNEAIEACKLTKHLKTKELVDSDIEKLIYDTNNKKWTNTINVSGKRQVKTAKGTFLTWLGKKYQYVSYLATFEPGSARSAEIWEKEFRNGAITASNTKKGRFNYKDIAIAVESTKGKKYIAYKSEDFDEDRYSNEEINGKHEITDFKYYNKDEDYFEDNFECGKNNNDEICIDDIDELESDFKQGRRIRLQNLDSASKVYFIYQAQNDTAVSEQFCRSIIKNFQGCGEQFDNTINYTSYRSEDFSNEFDEGQDEAKAIAICPFILTRQGGDVFFHSALETGIDVSACYKVENCEGPCITRTPPTKKTITKTGAGDQEEIVLQSPTHDVCKLSNDPNSNLPEAYRDVLKNFSSSVCELRADVAEIWTEKNINKAIKANIEKLARFGSNKGSKTLKTPSSVQFQNGVYVQDGGTLTISGSPYQISSEQPSAQTYIVRNGDLVINSNIIYNDQNVDPTKPKSIPSAAFIVINGDIKISNNVSQIDAIIMAVDSESNGKGRVVSLENQPTYEKTLTINGSLIGDVANIFENRQAIGDPLKDQSSITIKYDERILLNTPPGLSELIDINQLKIAN